jgi:hypothetical protein
MITEEDTFNKLRRSNFKDVRAEVWDDYATTPTTSMWFIDYLHRKDGALVEILARHHWDFDMFMEKERRLR